MPSVPARKGSVTPPQACLIDRKKKRERWSRHGSFPRERKGDRGESPSAASEKKKKKEKRTQAALRREKRKKNAAGNEPS